MSRHLIRAGSTICIGLRNGRFETVIGRNGILLFGDDFPLQPGKGYIINMLSPTAMQMIGVPYTEPIEGIAGAPSTQPQPVWAFAAAGEVADALVLPDGATIRVHNERTGASLVVPLDGDGRFAAAFVDGNRQEIVAEGDVLSFELVARDGYPLGARAQRRLGREELRQAFADIRLAARPQQARLLPNYPNPFNPETWIPFELNEYADVSIRIYGVRGELVRTLVLGRRETGYHLSRENAAYWDGRNEAGESVSSGVYVAELDAGSRRDARRMMIAR